MPQVGRRPNLAWVSPNFASSAATIRSQARASSRAPVKQKPLTLATTILGMEVSSSMARRAGQVEHVADRAALERAALQRLEVDAGAEGPALAGEHDDPHAGVVGDGEQGVAELDEHRRASGR